MDRDAPMMMMMMMLFAAAEAGYLSISLGGMTTRVYISIIVS